MKREGLQTVTLESLHHSAQRRFVADHVGNAYLLFKLSSNQTFAETLKLDVEEKCGVQVGGRLESVSEKASHS